MNFSNKVSFVAIEFVANTLFSCGETNFKRFIQKTFVIYIYIFGASIEISSETLERSSKKKNNFPMCFKDV